MPYARLTHTYLMRTQLYPFWGWDFFKLLLFKGGERLERLLNGTYKD
jgi:hypothetical protein